MEENIDSLIIAIESSLQENSFIKMSLGNYKGNEEDLKKILIRKIIVRKQEKLSFTYRFKTKDIVKNYSFVDAISIIKKSVQLIGFRHVILNSLSYDLLLEYIRKDYWRLKKSAPSSKSLLSFKHDKQKNRKIEAIGKEYLHELNITDKDGKIYKSAQNKYKQINHYIEILSSLIDKLPNRELTNVVDMGAGKGYLTFALYDYLNNVVKKPTQVTGLEYRKDLVELCNQVAIKSSFKDLHFIQGTIDTYENEEIDILIALHACDTATDDAIYKGVMSDADLIVVAPCCHKQIRRAIEKGNTSNEVDFLTKYGVFLERQAEMVTDGIRALILNYFGYTTKILEFISDAHTPKNVLIIGIKNDSSDIDRDEILKKIRNAKLFFGIEYHHLERIMQLDI